MFCHSWLLWLVQPYVTLMFFAPCFCSPSSLSYIHFSAHTTIPIYTWDVKFESALSRPQHCAVFFFVVWTILISWLFRSLLILMMMWWNGIIGRSRVLFFANFRSSFCWRARLMSLSLYPFYLRTCLRFSKHWFTHHLTTWRWLLARENFIIYSRKSAMQPPTISYHTIVFPPHSFYP
jgi:hypothetical protein